MTKGVQLFLVWLVLILAWSFLMGALNPPLIINIVVSFAFGWCVTGFLLRMYDDYR